MVDNIQNIRSKERVRDLAEVFTGKREVSSMLDLVKYLSENLWNTFLEPSCGNGNFLTAILTRRLETIRKIYGDKNNKHRLIKNQMDVEFYTLKAVASIYGIDISKENILDARQRMLFIIKGFYSAQLKIKKTDKDFWNSLKWILCRNIIVGDMLNKMEDIVLVEYTTPKIYHFKRTEFLLLKEPNTLFNTANILKNYHISNYKKLCS